MEFQFQSFHYNILHQVIITFDHLEEYYDYDTEEYNKFIDTMMKFIDGDEEKETKNKVCQCHNQNTN